MPLPTDLSGRSGKFVTYFARTPSDPLVKDDRWITRSVQLGARNRISTASIEFDRTRYLESGSTIQRPMVFQDSRFAVAWQDPGQNGGTLLFDGFVGGQPRDETGTAGASQSTESVSPVDAVNTWAQAIESQITGAHFAKIANSMGEIVLDESMPVVFNPDGLANRSVETTENTNVFTMLNPQPTAHYFTTPDGWDYYLNGAQTRKARYWTFSQAIAYVLWWWCGVTNGTAVNRNNVNLKFGTDLALPNPTDNLIWSTVSPHILEEVPGEVYEGDGGPFPPAPTDFDVSPQRLLTAKVPGIDVTGMNAIEALRTLCEAAGLGFYADCRQGFGNIDAPPSPIDHFIYVWTPGGSLNADGVGEVFVPALDPHGADHSALTALEIAQRNTLEGVQMHHDYVGLVNAPVVRRQPTRYEITMELRPLWRPIHPSLTQGGDPHNAYIDNVDSNTSIEPGTTEEDQALSDGWNALFLDVTNPTKLFNIDVASINKPIAFIARALNSKGDLGQQYHDVLRKWGVPTDWRYPNNVYARSSVAPSEYQDYTPINFNDMDGVLTNPITSAQTGFSEGAESWPQRARPFLPLLVGDSSGQNPSPIVEISLNGGVQWFQFDAITTSATESALWLNFTNPFHVTSPEPTFDGDVNPERRPNLFDAYIKHQLRVRVTCTIEGSDPTTIVQTFPLVTDNLCRAQVFKRGPRYSRNVVHSKFKDQTTPDANQLADLNDNTNLDGTNTMWWFFRPTDDEAAMRSDGDRIRAYYGDRKVSGNMTAYYIDLVVSPGMVVPRIHEPAILQGVIPREYEFETSTDNNVKLAPHVAGVIYTMGENNLKTTIMLEDWRSLPGLAGRSI